MYIAEISANLPRNVTKIWNDILFIQFSHPNSLKPLEKYVEESSMHHILKEKNSGWKITKIFQGYISTDASSCINFCKFQILNFCKYLKRPHTWCGLLRTGSFSLHIKCIHWTEWTFFRTAWDACRMGRVLQGNWRRCSVGDTVEYWAAYINSLHLSWIFKENYENVSYTPTAIGDIKIYYLLLISLTMQDIWCNRMTTC